MPRRPEDPPHRIVLERRWRIVVGDGGHLSWDDARALALQLERQRMHARGVDVLARAGGRPIPDELPLWHLVAIVEVLEVFDGATVEDWDPPMAEEPATPEADRYVYDSEWAARCREMRRRRRAAARTA